MSNYLDNITNITIDTSQVVTQVNTMFDGANVLMLYVYNVDGTLLKVLNVLDHELVNNNEVIELKTSVHELLRDVNLYSGNFRLVFKYVKMIVGDVLKKDLYIHEISTTRREIRIQPIGEQSKTQYGTFSNPSSKYFNINNDEIYTSPQINFGADIYHDVINWTVEKITFPKFPYSVILKFLDPLPENIQTKDFLHISLPLAEIVIDNFILIPSSPPIEVNILRSSNFNIKSNQKKDYMGYKNWTDLVTSDSTVSAKIVDKYFGTGSSDVTLNVDYNDFNNYIFYSNAEQRIRNFKYKVVQLETYDSAIETLETSVSSSAKSSSEYTNNIVKYTQRKDDVITKFDDYERYLYYESSSYVTSSYGEFYPTTWPKSTSLKPYTLYASDSSAATNWFNGIIISASLYDRNNDNALVRTIPEWIREDEYSSNYEVFVSMVGQQMDSIWQYVKQMTNIHDRDESLYSGMSKDLVYHVLRSYGWDGENDNQFDDLWYYTLGTNETGGYIFTGSLAISQSIEWITASQSISTDDANKEIWKRILNNLPYLNKNKGTKEGISALISCYGIPSTELHIREFGGPEPLSNDSYYEYRKFTYSLKTSLTDEITIPTPTKSGSIEFRFKTLYQTPQTIFTGSGLFIGIDGNNSMSVSSSNEDIVLDMPSTSVNDGDWWSFMISHTSANEYTAFLKKSTYGQITHESTKSIDLGASYPGTDLYSVIGFSGSLQEFRLWNTELTESKFDNHVLSPTSYNGNSATASYDDLWFRLPLGTDTMRYNHSTTLTLTSQQPNWRLSESASFTNFSDEYNYDSNEETYVQAWPDISANRTISNKVRSEDNLVTDSLYFEQRVETSAYDTYPLDNAKVGIYFSPTNEVNQDIAEHMGSVRIDDYIGAWDAYYTDGYEELNQIRQAYFKQYSGRYNVQDYFRLVNYFNHAVFKHIKEIVPAKTKALTGLVIEPHVLNRSKFTITRNAPRVADKTLEQNINIMQNATLSSSLHTYNMELSTVITGSRCYSQTEIIFPDGHTAGKSVSTDSSLQSTWQPYLYKHWDEEYRVWKAYPTMSWDENDKVWIGVLSGSMRGEYIAYVSGANIYHDTLPQGIKNHRYDGCKMISTDWNVDSDDTYDKGPVVEFTETNDTSLYNQTPNSSGNLGVR